MRCLVLIFIGLLGGPILVDGQQSPATPVPQPAPISRSQVLRRVYDNNVSSETGSDIGNPGLARKIAAENIEPLYRDLNKEEKTLLAVGNDDTEKYAAFLRQPNTGIIKLAADRGCAENTKVVVASADCLKYSMPGAGASYSFRVKNYRIRRLADLTFTENRFQATGILLHGILVDIGDVSLDQVSLTTKGMKYLTGFEPSTDFQKAREIDTLLSKGIEQDGFIYGRALYLKENTTFVLRSIAYRGVFYRAVQGVTYNELNFDKRKDIIVAFRVVRRDEDGSLVILWKELESKKSPEIKNNSDRGKLEEK